MSEVEIKGVQKKYPKIKGIKCRFCHDTGITVPWDWYSYTKKQFRELHKEDTLIECDMCDKSVELKKICYGDSIFREAMIANDYGAPPIDLYNQWIDKQIKQSDERRR